MLKQHDTDLLVKEKISQLMLVDIVARYYVTLNMGEALQCIDGANCVNLINSPQSLLRLENHWGRRSSPSYYRIMLLAEILYLQYAIVTNMVSKKVQNLNHKLLHSATNYVAKIE